MNNSNENKEYNDNLINVTNTDLIVSVNIKKNINYVSYQCEAYYKKINNNQKQNMYSLIESIIIENKSDNDYKDIKIAFDCNSPLIEIRDIWVNEVLKNSKIKITENIAVVIKAVDVYNLSECTPVSIMSKVYSNDQFITEAQYSVFIHPMDECDQIANNFQMISCYVTPNDYYVNELVKASYKELREIRGGSSQTGYIGYQANDAETVIEEMKSIYNTLAKSGISYSLYKISYEAFQRVRTPAEVLKNKIGTCLDLSILYASCLESIGLNPIIVFIKEHAFVGVFLEEKSFINYECTDVAQVYNASAESNLSILLVECTMFTGNDLEGGRGCSFEQAVRAARKHIELYSGVFSAIDVNNCHSYIYRPIPTKKPNDKGIFVVENKDIVLDSNDKIEYNKKEAYVGTIEQENKFNYWSRKLLDLSLRNKLINMKFGPSSPEIMIDSASNLIKKALTIPSVHLYPLNEELKINNYCDYNPKSAEIINNAKKDIYKIYTTDQEIVKIFRNANSAIEEKGSNILYLAVGIVHYVPRNSKKAFLAPVFLIPVKGKLKRDTNGFEVSFLANDVSINTTLFEFLKVECSLDFDDLYSLDNKGITPEIVDGVFNAIRERSSNSCSISVEDTRAFLATFSFANYIIWDDIRNRKEELLENKIIKSFVYNESFVDESVENVKTFDKDNSPVDLAMPLGADSSQIEAILDCAAGESFVLDGPPGTGKSQTIVNMIVNAMYQHKTVLFVAEKKAALDVVKDRLDSINLGHFCLELHSNKTNKKDFLEQLDKALKFSHVKSPNELVNNSNKLFEERQNLNKLITKIHKPLYVESLYDCICKYLEVKNLPYNKEELLAENDDTKYLTISKDNHNKINEIFKEIYELSLRTEEFKDNPFNMYDNRRNNYPNRGRLLELLNKIKNDIIELNALLDLFKSYGLNMKLDYENITGLVVVFNLILQGDFSICEVITNKILDSDKDNQEAIKLGIEKDKIFNKYINRFNESVFEINASEMLVELKTNINKKIKLFFLKRKICKLLNTHLSLEAIFSKDLVKKDQVWQIITDIKTYQDNCNKINKIDGFLYELLPENNLSLNNVNYIKIKENHEYNKLNNIYTNSVFLKRAIDFIQFEDTQKVSFVIGLNSIVSEIKVNEVLKNKLLLFTQKHEMIDANLNNLNVEFDFAQMLDKKTEYFYQILNESIIKMINAPDRLDIIVLYNKMFDRLVELNVPRKIIKRYKEGTILSGELPNHFNGYLYYNLINHYFNDPYFSEFNGIIFDVAIDKYNQLIEKYCELAIKETASRVTEDYPSRNVEYAKSSKIGGLLKYIKNGGHRTTIRNILTEYEENIRKICPCFLMSPQSAAQYLSVNNKKFDIVIFDEASQIPTCEAIGAISRGNSLIVAGDPEQMPPTSFFKKNISKDEVVEITDNYDDLESLLDDCLSLNMPRNRLLWHYRSQHESLISFSNNTFYDHLLYTFPSPDDRVSKVSYKYIANGVYDYGINIEEAKAIFEEVKRRFNDPELCKQSIGIITFNIKQQDLILDMINDYFDSNPEISQINKANKEELFVKDLENVQGHERDVIIFSIGFGYDKNNKFSLLFGPLSTLRGERRLNVAVTRARKEMIVFASIHGSDINPSKTKNEGPKVLKNFLTYAEFGKGTLIVEGNHQTNVEEGIEKYIKEDLEAKGYQCDINVGDSKFKINLCVKNNEGKYILGIICDGVTYKDTPTCRDRNSVQTQMLKRLKWKVIHVYTLDYFKNRSAVINTIINAINKAYEDESSLEDLPDKPNERPEIIFEQNEIQILKRGKEYNQVIPKRVAYYDYLSEYTPNRTVIAELERIINIEGPISEGLLLDKFKVIVNLSKHSSKSRRIFELHIRNTNCNRINELGVNFYYSKEMSYNIDFYRKSSYDIRGIDDIPLNEIKALMKDLLELHGKISLDDLNHLIANMFGVRNLVASIEEKIINKVKEVVNKSVDFTMDDEFIKLRY